MTSSGGEGAPTNVHANIHSHTLRDGTQIGAIGPVTPGLHNGSGPELIPGNC
jgi:hypothetical protein